MILSNLPAKALNPGHVEFQADSLVEEDQRRTEHAAAQEFLSLLNIKFVAPDGTPHAATVLSAASWVTGASLYRSLQHKKSLLPHRTISPQDVNREWELLVYQLEQYVFPKADIPVGHIVLAAMAAHHFFKPQVDMTDVQGELQEQFNKIVKQHGLDAPNSMQVGILLCSLLIQQYSRAGAIDADAATGVVAQEIFQAARQFILP